MPPYSATNIKNTKKKKSVWLKLISLVIFVALLFFVRSYTFTDWLDGLGYTPSSEMSSLISSLKLTSRAERIAMATQPVLQNRDEFSTSGCNDMSESSTLGCYSANKIYVYDSENEELDGLEESTLAHELLHAAWDRIYFFEQDELKTELEGFYQAHKDDLADYMKNYDQEQYYTELHSVIGTQYKSEDLPERLKAHYRAFFEDYDSVYGYYEKYNSTFSKINDELAELEKEINAARKEINAREAQYKKDVDQLNSDIDEFNARADNYYGTEADFNRERQALITRQSNLESYYNVTSGLVDAVNEKIAIYNKKALHHNDLIKSIDSKTESTQKNKLERKI